MNLFKHVELFGNSKDFTGKSFCSPETETFKCAICKKNLEDNKRFTCSTECVKKYKKKKGKTRKFYTVHNHGIELNNLNKHELILLMTQKYQVTP